MKSKQQNHQAEKVLRLLPLGPGKHLLAPAKLHLNFDS